MQFAERGVGGKRNCNDIADTADINENLVRSLVGESPAQLSNHPRIIQAPVLPLFFRPSTHARDCGYDREKGTTTAWDSCLSVGEMRSGRIELVQSPLGNGSQVRQTNEHFFNE